MGPEGSGVLLQAAGNDLAYLGAVLSIARPAWGYEVDPHAMADARKVLRKTLRSNILVVRWVPDHWSEARSGVYRPDWARVWPAQIRQGNLGPNGCPSQIRRPQRPG